MFTGLITARHFWLSLVSHLKLYQHISESLSEHELFYEDQFIYVVHPKKSWS